MRDDADVVLGPALDFFGGFRLASPEATTEVDVSVAYGETTCVVVAEDEGDLPSVLCC